MKVGLIYTSTTPELIELVEQEVKKQLGDDVELYSLQDPSILADVRAAGYVTTAPAARLIGMYMKAAEEGVDAMLNLCSSVNFCRSLIGNFNACFSSPLVYAFLYMIPPSLSFNFSYECDLRGFSANRFCSVGGCISS